jgi:hypothetical protein
VSSVLTLLFAPTFLILIQYFAFETVTLIYILLALFILYYAYLKKKKTEDLIVIGIYLLLLSVAYLSNSFEAVKFIPVLSAMTFFTIFAYASMKKSELIYKFTIRFYKKPLSDGEVIFLKNGDKFWAIAILFYALFLTSLIYYDNPILWAFFSSVGWYIYFVLTLTIQIFYGKLYAIKMYSK